MTTLGQVKAFEIGGSAVPPALVRGLLDIGVTTQNAFGMTENHSFQYTRPDDSADTIAATCGRPCEGMEIALWSESNQDEAVAQGSVGELGVRGASLMLGYFGDQASTERSFNRHGWFMTGDLARLDESRKSPDRRPQEGFDHPRRSQHLSGPDRGLRHALPVGRESGGVPGIG